MRTARFALLLLALPIPLHAQEPAPSTAPVRHPGERNADGLYTPGGDVLPPVLTHEKKPRYSRKDHRVPFDGVSVIYLVIDTAGTPQQLRIDKSCGFPDLDDSALEAVARYRFRPATKGGIAVPVKLLVDLHWLIR